MTHLWLLPYVGWEACQLEPGFARWMLRRQPASWTPNLPAMCPACRAIVLSHACTC
jgi:hypothetical protein